MFYRKRLVAFAEDGENIADQDRKMKHQITSNSVIYIIHNSAIICKLWKIVAENFLLQTFAKLAKFHLKKPFKNSHRYLGKVQN
jgi:hypothetical protein